MIEFTAEDCYCRVEIFLCTTRTYSSK